MSNGLHDQSRQTWVKASGSISLSRLWGAFGNFVPKLCLTHTDDETLELTLAILKAFAGPFEDDPNLTDKKFPGSPTQSYRTREHLRVTGEVADWHGHSAERHKEMTDHLERLKEQGVEAID